MGTLRKWNGLDTYRRIYAVKLLEKHFGAWVLSREVEAAIHATSSTEHVYVDTVKRVVFNVVQNPELIKHGADLIAYSSNDMAIGTIIEDIERKRIQDLHMFETKLQEKYEMVADQEAASTLTCRRCGSKNVLWDQKQTRSADEAMTIFCTCGDCKSRWRMG